MTIAGPSSIACTLTPPCACAAERVAQEPTGAKAAGAAAMTLSTGALACGACCVLPFTLPATILASIGPLLSAFIHMRWWLAAVSVIAVIGAWGWIAWQMRRTGRKPSLATLTMMMASTLLVTGSLLWPLIEKPLIHALRA
jgi:cytochrome bd-type quinol oxidase subunit 2